ncbi:histone-lysine N-methyltransferase SETMAR [Trichonephila clavipes]|nr:histone-lysine N-methyltransferase SETMAR [Trichonephila clavipes]
MSISSLCTADLQWHQDSNPRHATHEFVTITTRLLRPHGESRMPNAPRSGRPVEADKDAIKALVDANRRVTTREIGLRLNLSNSTVCDHLKGLGLSSKLDVWVPHVLTERIASQTCHENYPFLMRITTGDEKWVVCNNVKRKRSWSKKDEPALSNHFQSRCSPKKGDAVCLVGF